MDEITGILNRLNLSVKESKHSDAQDALTMVMKQLSKEGSSKKAIIENLVKNGLVDSLCLILKNKEKFPTSSLASVSEILADIAKLDSGRKLCSDVAVIVPLLELLSSNDASVVLQVCRALGNICYDNDVARSIVKENNGVHQFIQLLRNLLKKDNLPEQMRTITSGCLLNLTDAYEEIQEQAVDAGILDVLIEYLLKFSNDDDVVSHCLLVLSCLADTKNGRIKILEQSVLQNLLNLLDKPLTDEVMDSLLELFGNLCDSDSAKLNLAKMGLCEKLVNIVNQHQKPGAVTSDAFNVCKTISDLIILILNGDESMDYLWNNGKGIVYKETLSWLKSSDENLRIAGALVAGNFARKDSHCIKMLTDGVGEQLKSLLEKHTGPDGDIRMQHAVLSALKNLSIPAENKAVLANLGCETLLMNMMTVETYPVVFKLLGTMRMLLKDQEPVATKVGKNLDFLKRLVCWCNVDDHPGVKGEASRLLAWIAKYSLNSSVLKNLIKVNAVLPLVSMLKSEHLIMQNEGLVALNIIAACSPDCLRELENLSYLSDFVNNMHQLLKNGLSTPELFSNVLNLIQSMAKSEKIKSQMKKTSMCSDLKSLMSQVGDQNKELAVKVVDCLEKTP